MTPNFVWKHNFNIWHILYLVSLWLRWLTQASKFIQHLKLQNGITLSVFLCKSDVTEPYKLPKSPNHPEVTQAMFTLHADDTDKASVRNRAGWATWVHPGEVNKRLHNLYQSGAMSILWGASFMRFPRGTLDPGITLRVACAVLFKFHPSANDPSRVTAAIITEGVKLCTKALHILRYRSNMKINEVRPVKRSRPILFLLFAHHCGQVYCEFYELQVFFLTSATQTMPYFSMNGNCLLLFNVNFKENVQTIKLNDVTN